MILMNRRRRQRTTVGSWPHFITVVACSSWMGFHHNNAADGAFQSALLPQQLQKSSRFQQLSGANRKSRKASSLRPRRHDKQITSLHPLCGPLQMSLIPLPVEVLERVVVTGVPTGAQYSTYWGRTRREQYARGLESAVITFLGVFMAYFMSFVVGGVVATIMGTLFATWSVLNPEFQAYQRNWELRGGRDLVDPWMVADGDGDDDDDDERLQDKRGLYGALFVGYIEDVCVVEEATSKEEFDLKDFSNYRMETDELEAWTGNPYVLRVRASDREAGRTLQVHCRMSEEYLDLERNQPVVSVLLSTSPKFTTLSTMTDLLVPDAECWIGDYPYLDRAEMEQFLADDEDVWNQLQSQRWENEVDDMGNSKSDSMVYARSRKRNGR